MLGEQLDPVQRVALDNHGVKIDDAIPIMRSIGEHDVDYPQRHVRWRHDGLFMSLADGERSEPIYEGATAASGSLSELAQQSATPGGSYGCCVCWRFRCCRDKCLAYPRGQSLGSGKAVITGPISTSNMAAPVALRPEIACKLSINATIDDGGSNDGKGKADRRQRAKHESRRASSSMRRDLPE